MNGIDEGRYLLFAHQHAYIYSLLFGHTEINANDKFTTKLVILWPQCHNKAPFTVVVSDELNPP